MRNKRGPRRDLFDLWLDSIVGWTFEDQRRWVRMLERPEVNLISDESPEDRALWTKFSACNDRKLDLLNRMVPQKILVLISTIGFIIAQMMR